MHLNLTYDLECKFPYCYDDGKYGLDSSKGLLDLIISDMNGQYNSNNQIDVISIIGDSVLHGLSAYKPTDNNWDQMKVVL